MLKCDSISGYIILTAVKITKCGPGAFFFPFLIVAAMLLTLENRACDLNAGKSRQRVVISHQTGLTSPFGCFSHIIGARPWLWVRHGTWRNFRLNSHSATASLRDSG